MTDHSASDSDEEFGLASVPPQQSAVGNQPGLGFEAESIDSNQARAEVRASFVKNHSIAAHTTWKLSAKKASMSKVLDLQGRLGEVPDHSAVQPQQLLNQPSTTNGEHGPAAKHPADGQLPSQGTAPLQSIEAMDTNGKIGSANGAIDGHQPAHDSRQKGSDGTAGGGIGPHGEHAEQSGPCLC